MNSRILTLAIAVAASVSCTLNSQAAFDLFEDFEDVAVGADLSAANAGENFNVGATSATNSGSYTVQLAPADSSNRVLQSTVVQKGLTGSLQGQVSAANLQIADATTGTLFYMLARVGQAGATTPDFNTGTSDLSTTPSTSANVALFETQVNTSGTTVPGTFQVRDGTLNGTTTSNFQPTGVPFTPGITYGIFQVINNTTDTTQFYYQRFSSDGLLDPSPVLFTGGDNNFSFRNSNSTTAGNALTNFLVLASGNIATQDTFFVDDIYVDTAGANLTLPVTLRLIAIPEPTALSSLILGVVMLGARRRRLVG